MIFDYPLGGLFLSAFLSSTLLPGGSEAVLAVLTSQQTHSMWLLLTIAAAGNTLGGMTSWLLGRIIAIRYPAEQVVSPRQSPPANNSDEGRVTRDEAVIKIPSPSPPPGGRGNIPFPSREGPEWSDKHQTAVARLRRWGAPVLLLSWLPLIGDPLCVAAGWLRMHWLLSLVLIGFGKTARYLVVIYLFV